MNELTAITAYALADPENQRLVLQVYGDDGQIYEFMLPGEIAAGLLAGLQRSVASQRKNEINQAVLTKPQPPSHRIDGWEI